jgi:DNA-binding GntR family transcriptional regulator
VGVNAETAGERAYRHIRRDILFGRLGPAKKLKLDSLKESYGVSISTLRELLSRLSSEGLIVAEGARGFEVAPISSENLKEVANLRQLLECHAMALSFAAGDMEWEGRVVAAHHKLAMIETRMLAGDRSALDLWKRYDWEFHHALISACGSRAHLDAHNAAYDKYWRYQMIAVVFRGEIAAREHRQLLECALKRDTKSAQGVLVKHIQDCVSYTLANWPSELRAHSRAPAPGQASTSRAASA